MGEYHWDDQELFRVQEWALEVASGKRFGKPIQMAEIILSLINLAHQKQAEIDKLTHKAPNEPV